MVIKTIILISVLTIAGCSVFPNTTSISATTKATDGAIPTVKVQQNFKWSR
jgi:hypothetical protein